MAKRVREVVVEEVEEVKPIIKESDDSVFYQDDKVQILRDRYNFTLLIWSSPKKTEWRGKTCEAKYRRIGYYGSLKDLLMRLNSHLAEYEYDYIDGLDAVVEALEASEKRVIAIGIALDKAIKLMEPYKGKRRKVRGAEDDDAN